MWKVAHKRENISAAFPDVTELYRNNKFATDSLSSVDVKSVKITRDGQIKTKTVGNIGDRHLQADLNLPGLQERCAVSANNDLFRLSKLLDANETEQKQHSIRLKRARHKDCKLAKQANTFPKQPTIKLQKPEVHVPKQVPTFQRKTKRTEQKKCYLKKHLGSSEEDCYESAESDQQSDKRLSAKCLEQAVVHYQEENPQLYNVGRSMLCHNCYQKHIKVHGMAPQLMRFGKSNVSYLSVALFIGYHLMFWLCIFAFFSYILCYDVIKYVNEERRYLAKMKSACFVAKCFYYPMRLLKVPMF